MNIRATALTEFWGGEYAESAYLWEGAKHPLTLSQMEMVKEQTLTDLFATPARIADAASFCQEVYADILPRLSAKLNELCGVRLPASFWRTAFGYWLYRHISITYDKYAHLSGIDINQSSMYLLDKESFYIPHNHFDYVYCFCNDYGVQQLVSQYCYLFGEREFPSWSMEYQPSTAPKSSALALAKNLLRRPWRIIRSFYSKLGDVFAVSPSVVMCGVFNTADVAARLHTESKGAIAPIAPPSVCTDRPVDKEKRKGLLEIASKNDFERYLIQTFFYCLPQMFLEQFPDMYWAFLKDVRSRKYSHIVSENWISDIHSSIYIATAQNEGRTFIAYEHGSGTVFDKTMTHWIDIGAADRYVTVGWELDNEKVVPGGFMCRDIRPYHFEATKSKILYIARTNFPYMMEFDVSNVPNSRFINGLKRVRTFFDLMPESLSGSFVFRPRREANFWDTEHALEVMQQGIAIDRGNFSQSVLEARIVVIDHLTTGIAEILLSNVPCLIIIDEDPVAPVVDALVEIMGELRRHGVVHSSAESAVSHLNEVYLDVYHWWCSQEVQSAVDRLVSATLAPSGQAIDYLLSCLKQ